MKLRGNVKAPFVPSLKHGKGYRNLRDRISFKELKQDFNRRQRRMVRHALSMGVEDIPRKFRATDYWD